MKSTINLTSLATSAGKAHGAVVAAAIRGSKSKARPAIPPMSKFLPQLQNQAEIPQRDFDKLNQIVALATDKPTLPVNETLALIRKLHKELQQKSTRVHPLVLAIASIADDSAATALSASSAKSGKTTSARSFTKTIKTVAADVAGAVLGALAGAKASNDPEVILVAAIGGAILASSEVGAGKPFPGGFGVIVE